MSNDAVDGDALDTAETGEAPEGAQSAEQLDAGTAETGEAQEGAEPSESSADEDGEQKSSIQKRFDELTRQRREAERERDWYREQLSARSEETEREVDLEGVKTLEDFEFDERKYQTYLFGEAQRRGAEEAKRVLESEHQRDRDLQKLASYEGKEAEFAADQDDFFEATRNPNLAITAVMHDIITEMDNGPGTLYYLAKNPEVSDRISRLPDRQAAIELGRRMGRLSLRYARKPTLSPRRRSRLNG